MRHILIIIFIFAGQICHGQWRQDTTISKKMLDSLHQELVNYKDAAKQTYFNQIITSNTIKVDSFYSEAKDTLTITNYSKSNRTLRKQEINYNKAGCKSLLIDSYFDTAGRKVYEEQWRMGCNLDKNITGFYKDEQGITMIISDLRLV